MNDTQTSRRRFIIAALTFSTVAVTTPGLPWLRASKAWAGSASDKVNDTLTRLARLLFPHDGISDNTYAEVMGAVLAALANNPATDSVVAAAEVALDTGRDVPFAELDEAEQVAAIEKVQREDFFAVLLGTVRGVFYYHPKVWEHLGYPGSSKEFGGYINRGFDDIDWLPGDA